jgi:hypothetical protein
MRSVGLLPLRGQLHVCRVKQKRSPFWGTFLSFHFSSPAGPVLPVNKTQNWLSGPGFQDLNARFQALNARFQDLIIRTWVSGPRYLALRTWVSGSRKLSILRSSYLFPVTFLCVHRHFSFSRHFSLRPPSLFSASSGHRPLHFNSPTEPVLLVK